MEPDRRGENMETRMRNLETDVRDLKTEVGGLRQGVIEMSGLFGEMKDRVLQNLRPGDPPDKRRE